MDSIHRMIEAWVLTLIDWNGHDAQTSGV